MDDRWYSIEEIGQYLGIKRDTVYKWIKNKGLPCHRVGRSWKFKPSEVDAWITSGQAGEEK